MKRILYITLLCFSTSGLLAQEFENVSPQRLQVHEKDKSQLTQLEILEDSLVFFADSMFYSAIDEARVLGNYEFIRILKQWMKTPGSLTAPLNRLKEKINVLDAPDKAFRLYNWEVILSPSEKRYYGSIQTAKGQIFPLVDVSDQIVRGTEDSVFGNTRWYGNLIYKLLLKEVENEKYYFLLGWNGNNFNSDKKIMDVLHFDQKGNCTLGAPLFDLIERGKVKRRNRLILEYVKGAKVYMNYDEDSKQLIFDHCESQIGDPAKKYSYIPDGTYDGLTWNGRSWVMKENVVEITILKDGEAPLDKSVIKE